MNAGIDFQTGARRYFLQEHLIRSVEFGLTTTLVPIVLEVGAAVLLDRKKVWQNISENWGFNLLVLAVFFLAGAFVGGVRFILSNYPVGSGLVAEECTRAQIVGLLESCHDPAFKTVLPFSDAPINGAPGACRHFLLFLEAIGLIQISKDTVTPVSHTADSFLCSLTAHIRDGNTAFMGDWRAGSNEAEAVRLTKLIESIEQYRMLSSLQANASPARRARAGIALIRADFGGVQRFLVIKSYTWDKNGAWTPVMGSEEKEDAGKLLNTVKREVHEEMKIRPDDIVDARELATVNDKRISKRLGIYTEYIYAIFAVQLRQASPLVQSFFIPNPQVVIDYSKAVRIHEFTWLTWQDLLDSAHLQSEMPTVVDALNKILPSAIPQTVSL